VVKRGWGLPSSPVSAGIGFTIFLVPLNAHRNIISYDTSEVPNDILVDYSQYMEKSSTRSKPPTSLKIDGLNPQKPPYMEVS